MLIGDDQVVIAEAERLARTHIGCHVVRPSKYYRSKGHHQETFNSLALHVRTLDPALPGDSKLVFRVLALLRGPGPIT